MSRSEPVIIKGRFGVEARCPTCSDLLTPLEGPNDWDCPSCPFEVIGE